MRSHLWVGLFISIALAMLLSFTIWLSGRQGNEAQITYSMFFTTDVSGLMMGGPVYYLGVEVGTVTRMDIIQGDPMTVRVDVQILESTPVDTGTTASLQFQGITGVAVINLSGEPGMNLPLKKPPGYEHPVIEVRDAGLVALLSDLPAMTRKINELLDQAALLVGEENRDRIGETLSNVESVTATLRAQEEALAALPRDLNATMDDIRGLLDELQTGAENIRPGFEAVLANVEQMSTDLGALTARLNEWTESNSGDMSHFLDNGLGEVPDLVADARVVLREMEKLLRELRENPSRLIYKPPDNTVPLEP